MLNEIGSLYWVITHKCNGSCGHCYMDCGPDGPSLTTDEAERIVRNLPRRINHNIIISGGEVLHPANRNLLFTVTESLLRKYGRRPISLQTNGDFIRDCIDDCVRHGVTHFSVASMDEHHNAGGERIAQKEKRHREFLKGKGMRELPPVKWLTPGTAAALGRLQQVLRFVNSQALEKPNFSIWGANEDIWLGGNWARGAALRNGLEVRDPKHNFCAMWSGGLNFLRAGSPRQEVVLQLSHLFPCCPGTRVVLGDMRDEPMTGALERAAREPVFRAINRGRPYNGAEYLGVPPSRARARLREIGNICLLCDELLGRLDHDSFPLSPFDVYGR